MNLEPYYIAREDIVRMLRSDLMGPKTANEVLTDPPITEYAVGILYPVTSGFISPEFHIDEPDGYDEESRPDPAVSMASTRYPSSMGLTFAVTEDSGPLRITVSAARYVPEPAADGFWVDDVLMSSTPPSRARARNHFVWRREPIGPEELLIDPLLSSPRNAIPVVEGLELFYRVRPPSYGAIPITLALVNRLSAPFGERDAFSFFQPQICVSAADASEVFVERTPFGAWSGDQDVQSNRLIYRHAKTFAVGHGTGTEWEPAKGANRARTVKTNLIPEVELLLADSNPLIESPVLTMKTLADGSDKNGIVESLSDFVSGYRSWIEDTQAPQIKSLPVDLQRAAEENLDACRSSAQRMQRGIVILENNDETWEAFKLANRAMLEQRARTEWLSGRSSGPGPTRDETHAWKPFQLAFILQCLEGIVVPDSTDREIMDLLWFPTGGGKTEAYLGLIAFTTFHRRLMSRSNNGGGVTALMRYTLRLLTIQQFERAALLIAACEQIRNTAPVGTRERLGSQPISIGLWVGEAASPNSRSEAAKALDKLRNGVPVKEGNPIQLHRCPWCGKALGPSQYLLNAERTRLVINCRNDKCEFNGGLPVFVVDDDIYDHRPTLIIATVDKFASLPWRDRTSDLFNLNDPEPPPQLIIQDELHLISGPLGTMTGLYESAVDFLCSYQGNVPKIIASTATIRRANDQTLGLFARTSLTQFPPPALDARDSYFAVETPTDQKGNRLYVGLMAPGTSHTSLLVRTYASLLQSVVELPVSDEIKDPYWTLVGFFNSLRVLGGARVQVNDDVQDRIELLASLHGTNPRDHSKRIELTSRESSAQIPGHLNDMALSYPDEEVVDVILATNMISVGVDVDRLGLMAVMGQPPSTSEYIQATSRVGRKWPGLVVTLFNASRSRDRSHYELFTGYHGALYRQVEATSVTPFSPRARDRGLHAVVVALARMLVPEFRGNGGAAAILTHESKLEPVRAVIARRVSTTTPAELDNTMRDYEEVISEWKRRAAETEDLVYSKFREPDGALLVSAGSESADEVEAWDTLWSLRDVDRSSNIYLVK
jgi:hypothetical protein